MTRTYEIPVPPSVNSLYANAQGKGRVKSNRYRIWLRAAENEMQAQQCRPFGSPAILTLNIPENTRGDLSNRFKAAEDLLVRCGVLEDDSKAFVRGIRAQWVPKGEPCTIRLEEA